MRFRAALIIVFTLWASALAIVPAAADVHPNTAPGFPADQSFHVGDIDSVNLFNGALTLTIPIGGSYPIVAGFSYGLKLVYNSNPWTFKTVHYSPNPPAEIPRTQAYPNPCSNAGLGWRISLGRFNPPCQVGPLQDDPMPPPIYQDENGTDHVLYGTLHVGDPEDALPAGVADVQYTRDGSYLRSKLYTTNERDVEFPDGSVRHFDSTGMPTKISDPFGNYLSISYPTNQWVLTDSVGRTQTITFRTDLTPYSQVVDKIVLSAFGNTTATYQFSYVSQTIGRPCPHNDTDQSNNIGPTVTVPLLTGVTLPDGSAWTMAASDYVIALPPDGFWPDNACTKNAGEITGLTLPTLGRMEWTWQTYYFPTGSTVKIHLQTNPGVATRTMRNRDNTVLGTWTYTSAPDLSGITTSREHTTTVVDGLGHRTVNYFSIALDSGYTGWSTYDYSLPFTRNQTLNVAPGADLNLSRQVYDGTPGTLLRSEYALYERDPVLATAPPDIYNLNRRPLRSRTVYNDDGTTYAGVVSSDFDGLGHYRTQQTEGSFPGSNVRTHSAAYNPTEGTYTVNAAANTASGYTVVASTSSWLLEAPASTSDSEGGLTAQTELCYSPGSAVVTRKRVHRQDGTTQGVKDLVAVYDLTTRGNNTVEGNVAAEKAYGGDAQGGIGTGNLCTLALPAAPEYEIDHTYLYGARTSSKYKGTGFFVLDQTIDSNTGLPSAVRDSASLETAYEYDALGRLTWSKPPQGGGTEYVYTAANPASNGRANVAIRRHAIGNKQAPVLATDYLVFDDFGRVYQEQKILPDGTTAKRQTAYDQVGNKSAVSEWTVGAPASWTYFLNYDPFGRAATIQPPDGSTHDVSLTYHGVRQVDRAVEIATASGTETAATTTEIYDRQGRLLSVTEPSGSGGTNVTTTYGYDVGNRLASVATPASVGGSPVTQTRGFTYDRAGLLLSETHPEKGSAGNGSVSYPRYDSRGHALEKIDGPNDLTFLYDAAERLDQVKETGSSGRLLKDFTYASANGVNNWSQGKLQQASRYNYLTIGSSPFTVQIAETYTYGGEDGRVSQRDTQTTTNGAAGEAFTQGFAYNDLGQVSTLTYPLCTHAGCTSPAIFSDVPAGAPSQREIEAIYPNVTAGCGTNPLTYCPARNITRAEMAVFLLRAKEGPAYAPPACTTPVFADVPCSNPLSPWVQELYRRGVTGGCGTNPLVYCPDGNVNNSQMAVFVIAMLGISPPACTAAPFADVPCTAFAASFIAEEARRQITPGCGGGNFCPNSLVTRAQMAGLLVHAFDIPVAFDPATPRSAQLTYTQGLLTGVTGTSGATTTTYGSLSYYPNLLVSQVAHGNGVTDTQGNDPYQMRRPSSLAASGLSASWSSGTYSYDGAGNIKAIGTSGFTYDAVSRLVSATLYDGPTGGGNQKQQSYTFDPFGNLTNIAGANGRATPTSAQTNRLNGAGTVYDAAGNLTSWNGATYQYDRFNQMIHMTSGSEDWAYLYTADDERIWSYNIGKNSSRWALRDLGSKVLREYLSDNGRWSVGTDYLYRDGLLLAAETQTGPRHFHLDHLGTPRLITRASGDRVAYHLYYPFGEETTAFNQDSERMKFTGHERDLASLAGAGDDLDYMHARHESPVTGRFLSVDTGGGISETPQSWNRYSYARENPLKYLDHDGKEVRLANDVSRSLVAIQLMVPPAVRSAITTRQGTGGRAVIAIKGGATSTDINFRNLQKAVNSPGIVQINQTSPNTTIAFKSNGSDRQTTLSDVGLKGVTLPTSGTAGDGAITSTTQGVMQVHIDSSLSAGDQAPVIAAELAGHVVPGLLGEGAAVVDADEHHAREDPATEAARRNREQTSPPQ